MDSNQKKKSKTLSCMEGSLQTSNSVHLQFKSLKSRNLYPCILIDFFENFFADLILLISGSGHSRLRVDSYLGSYLKKKFPRQFEGIVPTAGSMYHVVIE